MSLDKISFLTINDSARLNITYYVLSGRLSNEREPVLLATDNLSVVHTAPSAHQRMMRYKSDDSSWNSYLQTLNFASSISVRNNVWKFMYCNWLSAVTCSTEMDLKVI